MVESKDSVSQEFWLFRNIGMTDLIELRKFIDPAKDISALEGTNELLDKLNHLVE